MSFLTTKREFTENLAARIWKRWIFLYFKMKTDIFSLVWKSVQENNSLKSALEEIWKLLTHYYQRMLVLWNNEFNQFFMDRLMCTQMNGSYLKDVSAMPRTSYSSSNTYFRVFVSNWKRANLWMRKKLFYYLLELQLSKSSS